MTKVEFGLVVPGDALEKSRQHRYMEDVNRLLNSVKGSYHSAWFIDHLQFEDSDVLEGWTALTYLCALHPELQWGHSVLCQSFRNPALVAKMAATLQFLSGGRYILGIGAGWHEPEYLAYGYDFPPASRRVEELDEALYIIKALWTQKRVTFQGKHYHVAGAYCEPKPDPIPTIMVGAFKPKMLRVAAKHADWWNVSSTSIGDYRHFLQEFEQACEEVGRDPKTVRRSWGGGCACAPSEQEVAEIAQERLQPGEDFVGTPEQLLEQMQPFVELGVDYFMLDCSGFPNLTTVKMLVNEVLPALNGRMMKNSFPHLWHVCEKKEDSMTHQKTKTLEGNESQASFEAMVREKLQQAVRTALMSVLEEEVDVFIGTVRDLRIEQRRDYRNGYYARSLETSLGHIDDLSIPRTRGGYQTQLFERYHRRRRELDQAIGEMFIGGVSMERVGEVVETLTGKKPSASTVSRVFHNLESEYEQ